MMKHVLFITWDGPQTSYLEGLFLPIFKGLHARGYRFHVLQFTWSNPAQVEKTRVACEAVGVHYRAAPVWRIAGGLGPFLSAVWGARHVRRAIRAWNIDILMPRSLLPALSVLLLRRRADLGFVFDADGFAADERVDFAALSPKSAVYRALRAIEARAAQKADSVLVRTPKAVDILIERSGANRRKFHVVSNGRDPKPFLDAGSRSKESTFRLCYVGSLGVQYKTDIMLAIARDMRADIPELTFRIFTGDTRIADEEISRLDIEDRSWIEVKRLSPDKVPAELVQCDLAFALRKRAFSTQGVSPIKIGEYLMAGLPVVGTAGVGDVDMLIEAGVMFAVEDDTSTILPWVRDVLIPNREALRKQARDLGLKHFSIDRSVADYAQALARL